MRTKAAIKRGVAKLVKEIAAAERQIKALQSECSHPGWEFVKSLGGSGYGGGIPEVVARCTTCRIEEEKRVQFVPGTDPKLVAVGGRWECGVCGGTLSIDRIAHRRDVLTRYHCAGCRYTLGVLDYDY